MDRFLCPQWMRWLGCVAGMTLMALVIWPARVGFAAEGAASQVAAEAGPQDPLPELIEQALKVNRRRYLTAGTHTPWQIMHGVLGLRQDFRVKVDGKTVPAIEWLSAGPKHKSEPWWEKTEHGGRAHLYTEPYVFQGHACQFLAILSMTGLPLDHQLQTEDGPITIADIVADAQQSMRVGEEPTWSLWALSHYLDTNAEWENDLGEMWSIERLVRSQFYEDPNRAACGGTHGMFALAYALRQHRLAGNRLRGVWLEADFKVQQYVETARRLQNKDGSFSGQYFKGPGQESDLNKRLGTSGHVLEFLAVALSDEQLRADWVHRAAVKVATDLVEGSQEPLKCGPMYHALDGLIIYRDRLQGLSVTGRVVSTGEPAENDSPRASPAP